MTGSLGAVVGCAGASNGAAGGGGGGGGGGGAFAPYTDTYLTAGTYTITIPTGAVQMVVKLWGAAAGGTKGQGSGSPDNWTPGMQGTTGPYTTKTFDVSTNNGQTMTLVIAPGGTAGGSTSGASTASTLTAGTFSMTQMKCNGAPGCPNITTAGTPVPTASGGTTNTSGIAGTESVALNAPPSPDTTNKGGYGGKGGANGGTNGTAGNAGEATFDWS